MKSNWNNEKALNGTSVLKNGGHCNFFLSKVELLAKKKPFVKSGTSTLRAFDPKADLSAMELEEPNSHTCPECHSAFQHKKSLNVHIKTVHEMQKNHPCSLCHKSFAREHSLKNHVATVHDRQMNHVCPTCSKAFGLKLYLNQYMTLVHEKLKKYSCTICLALFGQKGALSMFTSKVFMKS